MEILTKPLESFSFDDIVAFSNEKKPEGIQLDYKKEFPDKGLTKIITSFANSRGGVIIIGIEEDEKTGIPIAAKGIAPDKHDDRVYQYAGNISPIPKIECHTTNEVRGKVFVLIRVFEGTETPYYVYNDSNVWIRTGNVSKQIDLVSPEGLELLFKKKERAEIWRKINCDTANFNYQAFLKGAENERIREIEQEKENYNIKKQQHENGETMEPFKPTIVQSKLGTSVSMLKITAQPFFQQTGFVRPLDIEPIITESRSRNNIYDFPSTIYGFKSTTEGMISFEWVRRDGELICQQVFANGLVFSAHDILRPTPQGLPIVYLSFLTGELFVFLTGMKKILQKFGYQGSIIGEISLEDIEGIKINPVIQNMFPETKKSVFNQRNWQLKLDTQILFDNEKLCNYITEITRDVHWSFGYNDIQKKITVEYLASKGYFSEN